MVESSEHHMHVLRLYVAVDIEHVPGDVTYVACDIQNGIEGSETLFRRRGRYSDSLCPSSPIEMSEGSGDNGHFVSVCPVCRIDSGSKELKDR